MGMVSAMVDFSNVFYISQHGSRIVQNDVFWSAESEFAVEIQFWANFDIKNDDFYFRDFLIVFVVV